VKNKRIEKDFSTSFKYPCQYKTATNTIPSLALLLGANEEGRMKSVLNHTIHLFSFFIQNQLSNQKALA
jgi:hypothetical protein